MRVAFFSTMQGLPWGGSEELWSRAAAVLLEQGHQVAFNCLKWPSTAAPLQRLIEAGARPHFRTRRRIGRSLRQTLEKLGLMRLKHMAWLRRTNPDFVLISFSCHTDDPQIALTCRALGIRYAIVLQAAGPTTWLPSRNLDAFRAAYAGAERCYFVSAENRETLLSNLAIDLPQGEIVDNPFNVRLEAAPTWPPTEPFWKLACVARIHFNTKSQDLLVRVLAAPKWRARPLRVSLWGTDNGSLAQLRALIDLRQLQQQISYAGFAESMEELWSQHHGLLLPSRVEGNALSLIEAMLCGRVPITTNVGRAGELIDDNVSGFIAPAATAELVDEVLERAWQRRHDWRSIGQHAARAIRRRHSLRPAEDFAERILEIAAPGRSVPSVAA
jgi:glycosyltransferase involved in cell wall biosynthesis